jgi:hypothetical protein
MASDGRHRLTSPNEVIDAWKKFVAECENGYGWSIYEYENELGIRGAIESALHSSALEKYVELAVFQDRVTEIDKRFGVLLAAGFEVGGSDQPWWRRRLPGIGGEELASDARMLYGVKIVVV